MTCVALPCRECVPPGCLTGGSGGCTPAGPALQSPVAFVYPQSAERGIQDRTQLATRDWRRGAQAPPELGAEHAETQRHWQREARAFGLLAVRAWSGQPQPPQQAHAQAQAAPRRREVVVGGRRVKTIDVHALRPQGAGTHGSHNSANQSRGPGIAKSACAASARWTPRASMSRPSASTHSGTAERDLAAAVITVNNETLTAWCAAHPDRFLGFASVALQFPTSPLSSWSMPSRHSTCAAWPSGPAWQEPSSPIRSFIRSGPCARTRHPRLHSSAEHAGLGAPVAGQRLARQHHRQSTGHHHRVVAPHFRGDPDRFPGLKICRLMVAAICPRTRRAPTRACAWRPTWIRGCS